MLVQLAIALAAMLLIRDLNLAITLMVLLLARTLVTGASMVTILVASAGIENTSVEVLISAVDILGAEYMESQLLPRLKLSRSGRDLACSPAPYDFYHIFSD